MVLENYFPPDIRVEKEARSLLGAGHNIFLLSVGKEGMRPVEDVNGITVIRILPPQNLIKRVLGTFSFSILFESKFWRKNLEKVIKKYKIDIIHCHDLHLVKTSIYCAKKFDIPIVADLHENFPVSTKAWRSERTTLKTLIYSRWIFPYPIWVYKKLEKLTLQKVTRIITVIDEGKDLYINGYHLPNKKITVVMNTEDLKAFNETKTSASLVSNLENNFVITYIGYFGPDRGVDTAIKSMPKIIQRIPTAKLLIVGGKGFEGHDEQLKMMCKELKVEDHVIFTGWVDIELVPSYITSSDVCLVPHYANEHRNTSIPHKLFQYMSMKKPVIVTDCRPLKRIVEECNCGIVIPSRNHNKMAEAVISLYENKNIRESLGENGRKAVYEKYNWENEGKKLVDLYKEIEKEYRGKK
jgi:glycosyltransferase involved in cell wall biosynthesis